MDRNNKKFDIALTVVSVVLFLVILLGIGGGVFYFCYIDSISIQNGDEMEMAVSDVDLITVQFPDKIYINKNVSFKSSDPSVVSVDDNGKITGLKVGKATITATTEFFSRTASINVTVKYGEPTEVKVKVSENEKQYVGNEGKEIVFNAETYRNGFLSQDPETVSFKWEIFENGKLIKTETENTGKISYIAKTDTYKKITAKATVIISGKQTNIFSEQNAFVYDKLTEQNITLTFVNGEKAVMGEEIFVRANLSSTVDNGNIPTWSYSVNGGIKEKIDSNGLTTSLFVDKKGTYEITVTFTEENRTITKSVQIESEYHQIDEIIVTPSSVTQAENDLTPILLEASWHKYAMPGQKVTIVFQGKDAGGNAKTYTLDKLADRNTVAVNFAAENSGGKISIYVDDAPTGIVIDVNDTYIVKATAYIGDVRSNEFTYKIGYGEITNLKITASTDDVFDNAESDDILGRNNLGDSVAVRASIYPKYAAGDLVWYVNGSQVTADGRTYKLNCQSVGEYHVYCETTDGRVRSNTLSIPSTNTSVSNEILRHLGMVNGRSVNKYVTCQSDIDAILEYCFLNYGNSTNINLYIDTCMQDIWASHGDSSYQGERYWVNAGYGIYYVSSLGNTVSEVPYTIGGSSRDSVSRAFYRVGYSGNFQGEILQKSTLNREHTFTFALLPTETPTKVSTQQEMKQIKSGGSSTPPYSKVSGTNERTFAIDEIEQTVEVSSSSELFDAVANGFRPICKVGSMAEKIYGEARKVLTTYLTDTATDLEKVKFIYDWIIWEVTYDYAATEINSTDVNEAMRYSAYHLEGVFSIEGTIFENQIAVCDGRSKAYLLMCAIEGIPCIRVAGTCYDSKTGKNAGGHAWNKVYLKTSEKDEKGAWYVVDTTWGDGKVRYGFEEVEMYTDDFFLTTDNYHNNNRNLSYTCIEDETPYDIPRAVTEYNGF